MPPSWGSPETPWDHLVGVELTRLPDGSRSACIATRRGPVLARLREPAGCGTGALFVGPAAFHDSFATLCGHLARAGVATLQLTAPAADRLEEAIGAARGLLRLRGAPRVVLAGGGAACAAVLAGASTLDAEAVALLSPAVPGEPAALERLRGRPLLIFAPARAAAARATRAEARAPAELFEFAGAGETLAEVLADLAALCVPRLVAALAKGADAPGGFKAVDC